MSSFHVEIPDELVEAVVDRVLERLDGSVGGSPWLTRPQLAERLGVPVSRIEKDRTIPCHRWEGRVLYHASEVDEWLLAMEAR